MHVKYFARGGLATVKRRTVPRGDTPFLVTFSAQEGVINLAIRSVEFTPVPLSAIDRQILVGFWRFRGNNFGDFLRWALRWHIDTRARWRLAWLGEYSASPQP
jgi:hypothetical protein